MTTVDAHLLSPSALERIYRRNFVAFLVDSILFTLAMGVIGSTTVIPDFLRHLTSSEILIGFSGSLFSIGFTLPQLFMARYVVRSSRKLWWFVGPNILVRPSMLICAALTLWSGAEHPTLIMLAFFGCYGIAAFGDGLVGVPWADLAGTSLDNKWRARMFGLTSAITGVIMLGLTPLIGIVLSQRGPGFPANYAVLFGVAGVLFIISIVPGLFIHELPGGRARDQIPPFNEFLPDVMRVLRGDGTYRAFILVRILSSLFMAAAPYYIGFATGPLQLSSDVAVPVLLAMQTLGGIIGALVFTWVGAYSNLLFIRLSLAGSALVPLCALLAGPIGPLPLYLSFLMSGVATINLTFGYLNWVVGYANADERPLYVGLSNTVAALITLISPFVAGTMIEVLGYRPLFVFALVMALGALWVALRSLREQPHPTAMAH